MDEKVKIEILEAKQVKLKSNSLVDVPEWKRIRAHRVNIGDVANNIGWRFKIIDLWDAQKW